MCNVGRQKNVLIKTVNLEVSSLGWLNRSTLPRRRCICLHRGLPLGLSAFPGTDIWTDQIPLGRTMGPETISNVTPPHVDRMWIGVKHFLLKTSLTGGKHLWSNVITNFPRGVLRPPILLQTHSLV